MIRINNVTFRYILFWLPLPFIAIGNGILREFGYASLAGELAAHQISSISLILFFGVYTWIIEKKWQLTGREAIKIGIIWLFLTIVFEFGFGYFVMNHSWSHLLNDYNISAGRIWSLVLVAILFLPFFVHKMQQRYQLKN